MFSSSASEPPGTNWDDVAAQPEDSWWVKSTQSAAFEAMWVESVEWVESFGSSCSKEAESVDFETWWTDSVESAVCAQEVVTVFFDFETWWADSVVSGVLEIGSQCALKMVPVVFENDRRPAEREVGDSSSSSMSSCGGGSHNEGDDGTGGDEGLDAAWSGTRTHPFDPGRLRGT